MSSALVDKLTWIRLKPKQISLHNPISIIDSVVNLVSHHVAKIVHHSPSDLLLKPDKFLKTSGLSLEAYNVLNKTA